MSLIEWDDVYFKANTPEYVPYYLNNYYNIFTSQPPDIAFFITNSRRYIVTNINNGVSPGDPAAHYVRLYDILNDLQNFDPSLASYFSQYLQNCPNSPGNETATNTGIWLPVFPKQFYNSLS